MGGDGELCLRHLPLPASYGAANWPLRHVALSADGRDVAVAGRRGAALCCLATGRWRVFGDISQARKHTRFYPTLASIPIPLSFGSVRAYRMGSAGCPMQVPTQI